MGASPSTLDAKVYIALYEANKNLSDEELLTVFKNFHSPEGVNLKWMRQFMENAIAEGGNFEYLSTKDVCIDYIIPVCAAEGGNYIEYLKQRGEDTKPIVGPAEFYISHSWKYYYSEVLDALETYFREDLKVREVYVYFDLFCSDPQTVMSAKEHINTVAKFGKVVQVMCDLQTPVPFTSARCLLDVFLAQDMDIAMKRDGVESALINDLTSGDHLRYLTLIDDIDIKNCKTYRGTQGDFEYLESTFIATPKDYENFNRRVKATYTRAWVLDTIRKSIIHNDDDEHEGGNSKSDADVNFTEHIKISRLEALSMILKDLGQASDALEIRMRCLKLQTKVFGAKSPVLGATWANIAVLYELLQDWGKALEAHQTTLALYMQSDGAHAPVNRDLIHSHKQGLDGGKGTNVMDGDKKKHNEEARVLKLPLGPTHYHLAVIFEQIGDLEEALDHYKQALTFSQAHKDSGNKHSNTAHRRHGHGHGMHTSHPSHAMRTITEEDMPPHALKGHIGDILAKQGDLDQAIDMIREEAQALESLVGDNDVSLGVPYGKLSALYHRRNRDGDLARAQEYMRKAEDVAPKLTEKLHSLFDREESRRIERAVDTEMQAEGDEL